MSGSLTDDVHDWATSFLGIDTRAASGGAAASEAAPAEAAAVEAAPAEVAPAPSAVEAPAAAAASAPEPAEEGGLFDAAAGLAKRAVGAVTETVDAAKTMVSEAGSALGGVAETVENKAVELVGDAKSIVSGIPGSAMIQGVAAQGATVGDKPAPDTPADPSKQALYLKEAGDTADVSESDIHQGQVGDCFVLSSVGEIAKLRPDVIKKMIKDNGNGTYTVTLHQQDDGIGNAWGLFEHDYKEVQVTVTADTPAASVNHGAGQSEEGGKKEIWPLLLEKAYAQVNGGYSEIDKGGDPADALQTLTGHDAETKDASDVSLDDLKDAAKNGKPMTFNTPDDSDGILEMLHLKDKKKLPFGMHGNHAYMFEGLETGKDGKTYVRLKNPWGYDDPQLIPYDEMTKAVGSISTGSL
jgi:Calpain family cysteine protease